MSSELISKNFARPDEVRHFDKCTVESVHLGNTEIIRVTNQPGWRWSECVKSAFQAGSCPVTHMMYIVSGRIAVRMDNGCELVFEPGDLAFVPPGHDAWIVGNEPCISIDFPDRHTPARSHSEFWNKNLTGDGHSK